MAEKKKNDLGTAGRKDNHQSWLARLGAKLDPMSWIFGEGIHKYNIKMADWVNESLHKVAKKDPIIAFDRKYGVGQEGSPLRSVSDWAYNKPGDATALVVGAVATGGALAGAAGGGAGAAGGSAGAASGAAGASTLAGGGASIAPAGWSASQLGTVGGLVSGGGGGSAAGASALGTVNGILPAAGASAGTWTPASGAAGGGGSSISEFLGKMQGSMGGGGGGQQIDIPQSIPAETQAELADPQLRSTAQLVRQVGVIPNV